MILLNEALEKMISHKISMGKILAIYTLSFFLILPLCSSSAECATSENTIIIRYEALVESCQLRTVLNVDGNITVEGLIPAVMPEKDSMVPYNIEVPITFIRINPPWAPTPEMLRDPDKLGIKPFKGGQLGNPLGRIALYPDFKDPKFKYIRMHESPELPQRELSQDENGDLIGYRESHGCVGLYISDAKSIAARLTGLDENEINKLIHSRRSKYLPLKYQATIIFLKE